MNKTKIDWAQMVWNPITGCKHGCKYCYAARIAHRFNGTKAWPRGFRPMFRPERLGRPLRVKIPQRVFVGSMADMFGQWVPKEWVDKVAAAMRVAWWHRYMMLTKNPRRLALMDWQPNVWAGITAETNAALGERTRDWIWPKATRFLSLEPLQEPIGRATLLASGARWVIIGQETGNRKGAIKVDPDWVSHLVEMCRRMRIPVFVKSNIPGHWPREIPEELNVTKT